MANYNYTHGGATNKDRLRFLIGDHRGTNGTSATGWLFSDEELNDLLSLTSNDIQWSARLCIQCRACREALAAGVSGTTDTSDRPAALVDALRALERLHWPGRAVTPDSDVRADSDLPTDGKDFEQ